MQSTAEITAKILGMIESSVENNFNFYFGSEDPAEWNFEGFKQHYHGALTDKRGFKYSPDELEKIDKDNWLAELKEEALSLYNSKDELLVKMLGMAPGAIHEIE